ncbi:hypothetical protein [Natrinema sp. J7-1]|uniref:hypothetical protein n=1 Tax=Natrinema sp. J7-1 TaxID=1172566 RepID=UPI00026D4991|nr:hypothetical protein [Natrinema sp. J7-1]AFO57103.1 hypothetical protein NJ7G_1863 [Natrinema sp. J7-2]
MAPSLAERERDRVSADRRGSLAVEPRQPLLLTSQAFTPLLDLLVGEIATSGGSQLLEVVLEPRPRAPKVSPVGRCDPGTPNRKRVNASSRTTVSTIGDRSVRAL